jgi:hypothetical protein
MHRSKPDKSTSLSSILMSDGLLSLDNLLRPTGSDDPPAAKPVESAKTLESYHVQQLNKIREEKDNVAAFEAELQEKRARLDQVERGFMGPSLITSVSDITILTSRQKLESEIAELEMKIERLKSGTIEADYFLKVGDILFSYSDAQERIATGEKPNEAAMFRKGRIPANSVYSYFSAAPEPENVAPKNHIRITEEKKAASVITNTIGFKRDKALESYLSALNPDSIQHENTVASSITEDFGCCPVCEAEMFFNETFLDCSACGFRDYILVDSEKPSYKDPPREMSYYAYKKINHLNEWLAQFQAKETTEISQAVLEQIRAELKKERITDMGKLKPSKLKEVIKKLKLHRCYDHVAHILNRLNGISAPVLSREVEEKLRFMFKEIQFSFVKHCPKKRSNFLSYSFVLYKFCELLELDEYLPCFPLLKSREKLYMQDKIWKKICEDMKWQFIATV